MKTKKQRRITEDQTRRQTRFLIRLCSVKPRKVQHNLDKKEYRKGYSE